MLQELGLCLVDGDELGLILDALHEALLFVGGQALAEQKGLVRQSGTEVLVELVPGSCEGLHHLLEVKDTPLRAADELAEVMNLGPDISSDDFLHMR